MAAAETLGPSESGSQAATRGTSRLHTHRSGWAEFGCVIMKSHHVLQQELSADMLVQDAAGSPVFSATSSTHPS